MIYCFIIAEQFSSTLIFQGELIMLLRKLLVHFPVLPPHTARYLFNNLVSYFLSFKENYVEQVKQILNEAWKCTREKIRNTDSHILNF